MIYSKIQKIGKRIAKKQFNEFLEREKRRIERKGERIELNLFDSGLRIDITEVEKRLIEALRDKRRGRKVKRDKKR